MSLKMANPPVFYTIAQVKFNPVLDMGEFVGKVQKQWRATYPDFSQDTINEIQIHMPGPGKAPEVKTNSITRWLFKNIAKTSSFAVGPNFLSFQTTAYEDSDHFIATLTDGLSVLHSVVGLAYIESLSIRMLDAVVAKDGEELADYLRSDLLSLAKQLDGDCKQAISQLVMEADEGQKLTARMIFLKGRIGLPQELVPLPLPLGKNVQGIDGPHVILDNDCSQTKRIALDLGEINNSFRVLNAQLSKAFLGVVSDHALSVWR